MLSYCGSLGEVREVFRHLLEFGSVSRELCAVEFDGVAWLEADDTLVFCVGVDAMSLWRRVSGRSYTSYAGE